MPFLSKSCLQNLKNYKYTSCGYSWLDNKMNPFWEWFVKQMPIWLAPNLMTVIGFIWILIMQFVITLLDLSMTKTVPKILFLILAIAVFCYQTLDATDGKQARRTKSSSALGQLVDHGCDSFMTSFIALQMLEMALVPREIVCWDMVIIWALVFSAHWNERQTKILIHQLNNFGVTELQFIVIIVFIITSIFGQNFWQEILLKQIFPFIPMPEFFGSQSLYTLVHFPLIYIIGILGLIFVLIAGFKKTKNRKEAALAWIPLIILFIEGFSNKLQKFLKGLLLCHLSELQEIYALVLLYISIVYSTITCKFIVCSVAEVTYLKKLNFFRRWNFHSFILNQFLH